LKTPISPFFLFIILIIGMIFSSISPVNAHPVLNLTVTTDQQAYDPAENVTIYGNLTQDGTPVTDGLVGIQINDAPNILIIRTVTTGTTPQATPYVKLWSVVPCNSSGGPKESFPRGTFAYFKLTVTNYDVEPRSVRVTVNVYDPNDIPFSSGSFLNPAMEGQTTSSFIVSIPIPSDATTGNATAYGNAYTNWPELGGTPHCPEVSSTFLITDGSYSTTTQKNQHSATLQINGNYNLTLKLSATAKAGDYPIYVTSDYQGENVFNSTLFKVNLQGDIDGDGYVGFWDLLIFAGAYGSKEGDSNYDPRADFDHDGDVDFWDLLIIAANYGKHI